MFFRKFFFCLLITLASVQPVLATDYSSSNFTAVDPVITTHSGYSTSSHFQLIGSSGPLIIGEGSSPTYLYRAGFLYFPVVSAPLVSATAGDSLVNLNWTAASAALGFDITGYDVGVAQNSGGPYIFTSVGNVLTTQKSGLTNNTPYYFVVRVKDFYLNVIATSTEVVATPQAAVNQPSQNGASGGGSQQNYAKAQFSGKTFPDALVYILENGTIIGTVPSNAQGDFNFSANSLQPDNAVFTLYAGDKNGEKTSSVSYTAVLKANETVVFNNIILPPWVTTDKQGILPGESIKVFGKGIPRSSILVTIDEIPGLTLPVETDANGNFSTAFTTENFAKGTYTIRTSNKYRDSIGTLGKLIEFIVGDTSIVRNPSVSKCQTADFDCNGKVDLVDFSILLYWFNRPNPPPEIDLSKNGLVDLIDFSILMYYWTG